MATGVEMMMKAFGLNPEELKKQISEYGEMVVDLHARIVRIEAKLDRVLDLTDPSLEKGVSENVTSGNALTGK